MPTPIYDSICQQRGFDPLARRAARLAAAQIVNGITAFLGDLFGLSKPKKRADVALAR